MKSDWHFKLRDGKTGVRGKSTKWNSEPLIDVLQQTASYRATNPMDKVFALEGLLNPIAAQLLNVNYERSLHEVYRQITVQAVTTPEDFGALLRIFDFLPDQQLTEGGEARQPWPSWVFDLTYSNAAQHKVQDETIIDPTFEGALFSTAEAIGTDWARTHQEDITASQHGTFLTPEVLHCFGFCIFTDDAFSIELMPLFADEDDRQWHGFRNVFRDDLKASRNPYLAEPHLGGVRDGLLSELDDAVSLPGRGSMMRHGRQTPETPELLPRRPDSTIPPTSACCSSSSSSSADATSSSSPALSHPQTDHPLSSHITTTIPPVSDPPFTIPSSPIPLSSLPSFISSVLSSTPHTPTSPSPPPPSQNTTTTQNTPHPPAQKWLLNLRSLWSLGYNREEGAVWALSDPNLPPIVPLGIRCRACIGKHAIFLESGLVALSRAAYVQGDVLALLGGTGVFLHLRPVAREGAGLAYRVMSRVLVAGTLTGEVEGVLKGEEAQWMHFEIV